jgi:hypothetical protein
MSLRNINWAISSNDLESHKILPSRIIERETLKVQGHERAEREAFLFKSWKFLLQIIKQGN